MHYNNVVGVEKTSFFIKKMIHYGDGVEIPKPVGDENEFRFLILIGW